MNISNNTNQINMLNNIVDNTTNRDNNLYNNNINYINMINNTIDRNNNSNYDYDYD